MTGKLRLSGPADGPRWWVRIFGTFLGAAIVATFATDAWATCTKHRTHWSFGKNTSVNWRTSGGSVCLSTTSRPQNIEKIEISSKPQNGIAGRNGPFGVAYKPNAGYRGSDAFVYMVTSNSNYRKGAGWTAKITVFVTVE